MNTTTITAIELTAGDTIVGSKGGTTQVVGYVEDSSLVPGAVVIETEHGCLYLDSDETVQVVR